MIVSLSGTLLSKSPVSAVVECGGVGYEAFIPLSTYDRLPPAGEKCFLHTCHVVREDAQLLFGFATEDEKRVFSLCTAISGVGPKIALSLLSGLKPADLQFAVAEGDFKRLSSVKGVGRKIAERIVVELRGKVNPVAALAAAASGGDDSRAEVLRDAMMALSNLGYSEDAARKMVQDVLKEDASVADIQTVFRRALAGAAK